MIYLDNAATTIMNPPCVVNAVTEALTTLGNASRGTYEGALNTNLLLYRTRRKLADFFGCPKPEQVIFTNNSTEALNIAISGTIHAESHVVTTVLEHNSVLRPLYRLQKERGVQISFVQADRRGCVDYREFERLIRPNTAAIVCTHASNLTGSLLDILQQTGVDTIHAREIGLCRRFYEAVVRISEVQVSTWKRCPVVALNIGDADSALICDTLAFDYGIAVRAGAHCAPLALRALGTEAQGAVRFSFGYFNTEDDADAVAEAVREIA